MNLTTFLFIFLAAIPVSLRASSTKQPGVKFFAKLIYEHKRILNATVSKSSIPSLLQCVQLCGRRVGCVAMNYQPNRKLCELLDEKTFDELRLLKPRTNWFIYILRKAICEPNPCLNGGTCETTRNDEYRCICKKWTFGERCERDVAFKLNVSNNAFVEMPINFGQLNEFTMCMVIEQASLGDSSYVTIMNYLKESSGSCSSIKFDVNKDEFSATIFGTTKKLAVKPQVMLAMPVCITRRYVDQLYRIYIYNDLVGEGKTGDKYILSSPGKLAFGTSYIKDSEGTCHSNQDKFEGALSLFFLFNRFFTKQDAKDFSNFKYGNLTDIVISWDKFRNTDYWHNNVKLINIR